MLSQYYKWFRGAGGFAGRVVSRGGWFRGAGGFAGQVVSRGRWFRGAGSFAGQVVSRGNWFLVTLAKIFVIILMVKQITYNAKVSDITIL